VGARSREQGVGSRRRSPIATAPVARREQNLARRCFLSLSSRSYLWVERELLFDSRLGPQQRGKLDGTEEDEDVTIGEEPGRNAAKPGRNGQKMGQTGTNCSCSCLHRSIGQRSVNPRFLRGFLLDIQAVWWKQDGSLVVRGRQETSRMTSPVPNRCTLIPLVKMLSSNGGCSRRREALRYQTLLHFVAFCCIS